MLSRLFRRLFLQALQQAFDAGNLQFFSALEPLRTPQAFRRYLAPLRSAEWVLYTKAPFDGPQQVLRYVARYTHRVALSNDRLLDIEDGRVSFSWKDYRQRYEELTGRSLTQCPVCRQGEMLVIEVLPDTRPRRHRRPAPRPPFAHCPPFMDT